MDYYTITGMAALGIAAVLVGLRLAKDEILLRRKRMWV